MDTQKPTAKCTTTQAPESPTDRFQARVCRHAAAIRAVAQLLNNIADNHYECQAAWEEFGMQIDALSDALMERVEQLVITADECLTPNPQPLRVVRDA
jgi:hypothetical protein